MPKLTAEAGNYTQLHAKYLANANNAGDRNDKGNYEYQYLQVIQVTYVLHALSSHLHCLHCLITLAQVQLYAKAQKHTTQPCQQLKHRVLLH